MLAKLVLRPIMCLFLKEKQPSLSLQCDKSVAQMYPTILNNPDYTSIVNNKQYQRIKGYLDDAKEQGAEIIEINPANESFS
jgi:coniferyl-aldehyde dehydrogenase